MAQRGSGRYASKDGKGDPGPRGGAPSPKLSLLGLMDDVRTKAKEPLTGVGLTRPPKRAAAPQRAPAPALPAPKRAPMPLPPQPVEVPQIHGMPGMMPPPAPYWENYGGYGSSVPHHRGGRRVAAAAGRHAVAAAAVVACACGRRRGSLRQGAQPVCGGACLRGEPLQRGQALPAPDAAQHL